MSKILILVILGPTATGKTDLAVDLALKLNAEIVTADSMQVYRHMDIGTAKPDMEERRGVPHHLIDVADPDENFNVAIYYNLAKEAIMGIVNRGRLPILAGGTGLYIQSITDPYSFGGVQADPKIRSQLEEMAQKEGNEAIHAYLAGLDPVLAQKLHPNDRRRIIRALEVCLTTGTPLSRRQRVDENKESPFQAVMCGLTMERHLLYRRIEQRVDLMLKAGLLEEVSGLLRHGYNRALTSMQALGYKELAAYLAGETDLATAVELIKQGTRRLAKRQMTWFGRDSRIKWWMSTAEKIDLCQQIIEYLEGVSKSCVEGNNYY